MGKVVYAKGSVEVVHDPERFPHGYIVYDNGKDSTFVDAFNSVGEAVASAKNIWRHGNEQKKAVAGGENRRLVCDTGA